MPVVPTGMAWAGPLVRKQRWLPRSLGASSRRPTSSPSEAKLIVARLRRNRRPRRARVCVDKSFEHKGLPAKRARRGVNTISSPRRSRPADRGLSCVLSIEHATRRRQRPRNPPECRSSPPSYAGIELRVSQRWPLGLPVEAFSGADQLVRGGVRVHGRRRGARVPTAHLHETEVARPRKHGGGVGVS